MKPLYYLLERGEDPTEAFTKTYEQIMSGIEFRTWYRNKPLGSDYEDETLLYAVQVTGAGGRGDGAGGRGGGGAGG